MTLSTLTRRLLALFTVAALLFIYTPLALVVVNSFNTSRTFAWPPPGFTTRWWSAAWESAGARSAVLVSVEAALIATAVALVLGTMAALALQRFRFFGRDTVSLLIILPIALPGVVTGIALANAFLTMFGIQLGLLHPRRLARDVLHRHRLQQRHRPAAAARLQPRGGVDGPRCRHASPRSGW